MLGGARAVMMGAAGAGGAAASLITPDARTVYNQSSSGDPHTFNHTLGAGADFLIVLIGYENTRTVSDVKAGGSGGTSLTLVPNSAVNSGGAIFSEIWFIANPPTGTQEIWIDLSASGGNFGAEAVSLVGVDQSNPIVDADVGSTAGADGVTLGAALTVDGTNRLEAVACDGYGSTGAYTWNGSIAKDAEEDTGAANMTTAHQDEVSEDITPGVVRTVSSSQRWVLSAVLLKAA